MLTIEIPEQVDECWDEENDEFLYTTIAPPETITLEHSLVAISLWESKWNKPFLDSKEKTDEEFLDYIKCMTLTPVSDDVMKRLTTQNIKQIIDYIQAPMTATTFADDKKHHLNKDIVTSELIYYWMVELHIPPEFERWHIKRLLTLIRICEVKQTPAKKMSQKETMAQYAALNNARRKKYHSRG